MFALRLTLVSGLILGPFCAPATMAAAIQDWNALLAGTTGATRGTVLYCGASHNPLPQSLARDQLPDGVALVVVPGSSRVRNPFGGALVPGRRIHQLLQAETGTVVFLAGDGLPLNRLTIPWTAHGGRPELITLVARYLADGHSDAMSLRQFAQALGREQELVAAAGRLQPNQLARKGWHDLDPQLLPPIHHADTGRLIDPWRQTGVFYVIVPTGVDSTLAAPQLTEIWSAFTDLQPSLCLVFPEGDAHDRLAGAVPDEMPVLPAFASRSALSALGTGPFIVCTAHIEGRPAALIHRGYVSARSIALRLRLPGHGSDRVGGDYPDGLTERRPAALAETRP